MYGVLDDLFGKCLQVNNFTYDPTDHNSIQYPFEVSEDWKDFLSKWFEFDHKIRITSEELWKHPFSQIEDVRERNTIETINFISLFTYVAKSESLSWSREFKQSDRENLFKVKSINKSIESIQDTYKITTELFNALGVKPDNIINESVLQVNISLNSLNEYRK